MSAGQIINGTAGDDSLMGGAGDDQIFGGAGNDTLNGGAGFNTLDGGTGNDLFLVGSGTDTVTLGGGQNTVQGLESDLTITDFKAGAGGDVLSFSEDQFGSSVGFDPFAAGIAVVEQDGPNAVVVITSQPQGRFPGPTFTITLDNVQAGALTSANFLVTSSGAQIPADPQENVVRGGPGGQVLGAGSNHYVFGGDGADTIFGAPNGSDSLYGGAGNDLIVHGAGNAFQSGDAGDDTIWAGPGDDSISGGQGNDVLVGQGGNDIMSGGPGADRFVVDPNAHTDVEITDFNAAEGDKVVVPSGVGYTQVDADGEVSVFFTGGAVMELVGQSTATLGDWLSVTDQGGAETVFGPPLTDLDRTSPDAEIGGSGNDLLIGQQTVNTERGAGGADTLWGNSQTDFLFGGPGDDVLIGAGGADLLSGGPGADRFIINAGDGGDWITDFNSAEGDRVVLPAGTTYTLQQYDWGTAVTLSTGQVIGLQGVNAATIGDWVAH